MSLDFKAEIKDLLKFITNSLYKNKEVFLRELIAMLPMLLKNKN